MPTATTQPLKSLLSEMINGSLAVPNFQRDFVWSRGQVLNILESIRNGIPIGTVTLWKCSDHTKQYFEPFFNKGKIFILDRNTVSKGGWATKTCQDRTTLQAEGGVPQVENGVIDGRQRLTSLLTAFGGITFGQFNHRLAGLWAVDLSKAFDGEDSPFEFIKLADVQSKYKALTDWIRASKFPLWLFDDEFIANFQAELPNPTHYENSQLPPDLGRRASIIAKLQGLLSGFHVAVYSLERAVTLSQVCEIFEVLNTSGTKVSVFDIVHAKLLGTQLGSPFDLKSRVKEISEGSLQISVEHLAPWINENDGAGGKGICQIITGMYLGDEDNRHPSDQNNPPVKKRKIATFKGGDLIDTPIKFYRTVLDKTDAGGDVDEMPGLAALNKFAKDFMCATNGVSQRDWCPYPILFSIYCSIRHEISSTIDTQMINDTFRPFFWRACFQQKYDQGFLTGAVKDRDHVCEFIKHNINTHNSSKQDWWFNLSEVLTRLGLQQPKHEEILKTIGDTDTKGATSKMLRNLLFCKKPLDLKTKELIHPLKNKDIELHHIFPRTWVKSNCTEKSDLLDSYLSLVPMLGASNNEWKGNDPQQQLSTWHPQYPLDNWAIWEGIMGPLAIDQQSFTILTNTSMAHGERFQSFIDSRRIYLAEQLNLLMSTKDLPPSLQYTE